MWNKNGEAVFAFGANKEKTLQQVVTETPDYLSWMLTSEFNGDVKTIVRNALQGNYPVKPNLNLSK